MHEAPPAPHGIQGQRQVGTPLTELERLQAEQGRSEEEIKEKILESMLVCAGEVGYRRLAVERVYRHYGGYRSQFYKHFRNKEECFVAAYDLEANRIADRLVGLAEEEGPGEERLRRALEALAGLIATRPSVARALIVEVHVAGDEARLKRQEVLGRLSHALDRACRETASRHSPPPLTAEFMVCAVEQALSTAILKENPREFVKAVPELSALVSRAYVS